MLPLNYFPALLILKEKKSLGAYSPFSISAVDI